MSLKLFPISCILGAVFTLCWADVPQPTHIFHGSKVNTALVQVNDPFWREAYREVGTLSGGHLVARHSRPTIERLDCGNPKNKVVALTFDDGPHPGKVEELLALLKREHIKATFFVVGKMAEVHPELVEMESQAGHEIGNHSFSHCNLTKIRIDKVRTEYQACNNVIEKIIGHPAKICRPPGGRATREVVDAATYLGMTTVMWTDDPRDYANPGTTFIENYTLERVKPGAIILLHEGVDETMQVLPSIIANLRREGYRFVTVGQMIRMMPSTPNLDQRALSVRHHGSATSTR